MNERKDYISWQEYFMALAEISSKRSKDPTTQVGCCIVDPVTKRVMSLGYNGLPYGCSDIEYPWGKSSDKMHENKYPYVVHAELNAILSSGKDLTGCEMYVTYSPCHECMKAIIQSGIKRVYFAEAYKPESDGYKACIKMANSAGVELIQIKAKKINIE